MLRFEGLGNESQALYEAEQAFKAEKEANDLKNRKPLLQMDHELFFSQMKVSLKSVDIKIDRKKFGDEQPYVEFMFQNQVFKDWIKPPFGKTH